MFDPATVTAAGNKREYSYTRKICEKFTKQRSSDLLTLENDLKKYEFETTHPNSTRS